MSCVHVASRFIHRVVYERRGSWKSQLLRWKRTKKLIHDNATQRTLYLLNPHSHLRKIGIYATLDLESIFDSEISSRCRILHEFMISPIFTGEITIHLVILAIHTAVHSADVFCATRLCYCSQIRFLELFCVSMNDS